MRLIDELERHLAAGPGLFRAQLLREDLGRLRKLEELARSTLDAGAYRSAGRRLGWTTQDARTGELGQTLDRFLEAVRAAVANPAGEAEGHASEAWRELTRLRLETLVGCLSTPTPKLDD